MIYDPEDAPTRILLVKKIKAGQITKKEFRKCLSIKTRQQYNIEITRLLSNHHNVDLLEIYEKSKNFPSLPVGVAEKIASRLYMECVRIEVG